MKKIIKTIICAGFGIAMLASCEKELPHRVVTPIDAPAETYLSIEGVGETFGLMAPKTKSFPISIKADTKADQLLTFTIAPNPDKVAAYNQAHGTDYEMVPGDAYELSTKEFYLPRYNTVSSTGTLTIKANGLPDDGKTRVLPISISKIEGDAETKMEEADSTVYITVYRVSLKDMKFEKGKGTQEDPYLVEYANDMLAMMNDLKADVPTYIKLANDIDMSSIEEWMPVNTTAPYKTIHFDGDGHAIKNLYSNAADMPSLFGVIQGSVKNIKFENCTIEIAASNAGAGLIAGKALNAEIKNITGSGNEIKSMTAAHGSGKHLGGIAGIATSSKFEDINIGVSITDGNQDGVFTRMVGGLVGIVVPEMTDDDAAVKAFTDKDKGHCTFNNCKVSGNICAYHYSGGFIGAISTENTEITNCTAEMDMNFTAGGNYGGGFIGYANKGLKLTNCHAIGNVNSAGNYKGGFIGGLQGNATIKRCSHTGNMENTTGTHVGGFIGNVGVGTADYNDKTAYGNTLIEDCYRIGNHKVTEGNLNSGRMNGGFIAMIEKAKDVTVRRCYASGDMEAVGANGPISGFIAMFKMASVPEDMNGTVEQCIAWTGKLITSTTNADTWSSGAVVGVSSNTNTMTDCYRKADMEYSETCGSDVYTLYDQENSTPSTPLAYDPGFHKGYKCPYHGKAAPAGATCSSVAKSLNWPEDVWDLSGDLPKLK